MRRATILVAAALCALAAAATAGAAEGGARFSVSAAYDATPTPDPGCGGLRVVASGSAQGTHIGGSGVWNDAECADLVSQPGTILIHGRLVLTATDGAELFLDYDATTPLPDASGAIHPRGTFTIVGGSDRFAGASGAGTLAAEASVVSPATTAVLDGVIRLGE